MVAARARGSVTPERWQQIKAVLAEALDLPHADRTAFLERVCSGDPDLRREVDSLLAASMRESVAPIHRDGMNALEPRDDRVDGETANRETLARALEGHYEIIRLLGRGGMGSVYLARDVELDLEVAIKVLRPELAASSENRQRFKREARTAAGFKHANIVQLHLYQEVRQVCFFVMRYVPGGSLADRLRVEGAIPPEEARRILLELADALEYAHRHDVIHRDIKPANILFDVDRRPMLADFGIAKVGGTDLLTPVDEVRGTPHYMSPEQLRGQTNIDGRTDLYSLGLVGYAMLVGREAFSGMPVSEVFVRRLAHDPVPVQELAPLVPRALATIVMRCLERDRTLRYPDAGTLKDALENARPSRTDVPDFIRREILGFGQYAFVWGLLWTVYAMVGNHDAPETILTLIIAFLVPLGFALNLLNLGRHGYSRMELIRIAYWPPEWWGMWWPSILRRPTDLWPRLPWQARGIRVALSIFFVAMPALVVAQSTRAVRSQRMATIEYVLLFVTALLSVAAITWTRRRGLSFGEATRVLFGATMPTPAWDVSRVKRLLSPVVGVRPPDRDDPADYARAIDDLVKLWSVDAPPAAIEVPPLAHRLLAILIRYDQEIAMIDRVASPGEIERVRAQLVSLDELSVLHADIRAALREMKRRELEVLHAMRRARDRAADERRELLDRLKMLWTRLCQLHEHACGVRADIPDPLEALRSVCDQIVRLVDAPSDRLERGGLQAGD